MPVFAATVMSTLEPGDVARGSTLINVNQRMAGSIGAALASVILTGQLNRSANMGQVSSGVSRAYAVVFIAAVCVVALASIPAAFLPRKSVRS
jgi:DHA2 family multidrug resistance protein